MSPKFDPIEKVAVLGVDIHAVLRDGYSAEDERVRRAIARHPLVKNLKQMMGKAIASINYVPLENNKVRLEIIA